MEVKLGLDRIACFPNSNGVNGTQIQVRVVEIWLVKVDKWKA